MLCIGMLTHQPGLFRQYSCTVLLDWPFLAFLCSHAMLCGLCKIMWFDAGMRSSSHTLYNWVWTYAADKSMCMQVPSVDLWMKLFLLVLQTAKLYIPAMIAIIKYSWLQFSRSACTATDVLGSLNLCYQKKYLPNNLLPTTGWRNSSNICLQEGRPEKCGPSAESQCWPQPHNQGEYCGKTVSPSAY